MNVVQNGKDTSFWNDRWMGNEPLRTALIGPLNRHNDNITVAELWGGRGTWDWNRIDVALHPDRRSELAAKVVLNDEEKKDKIGWRHTENSRFTTKSAYASIAQGQRDDTEGWEDIWKIRVPNRVRAFIWLVKHKKIMCNAERKRRGFTSDERCSVCGAEVEDVEHTIRRCPAAEVVWNDAQVLENPGMSNTMSFDQWLTMNLTGHRGGRRKKRRIARFALTVWWIWKWRNDRVFNGVEKEAKDKVDWLHRQFKEVEDAMKKHAGPMEKRSRNGRRNQPWQPPEGDWLKINTDGGVDTNRKATCGGVFRNSNADFLGAFASKVGMCTPLEVEAWGIKIGLQRAWQLGYRKIELETDSEKAIKLITEENDHDGPASNIIELCRELTRRNWEVKLRHIPREQNKVADALAKKGNNQDGNFEWHNEAPRDIQRLLREDELGLLGGSNIVRVNY